LHEINRSQNKDMKWRISR